MRNNNFQNNPMLMNNPNFANAMRNPNFINRMNIAKMEQMKKIKNVQDLGLSDNDLAKYIINTIKIEKITDDERNNLISKYRDNETTYVSLKNYNSDDKKMAPPPAILELWRTRNNMPYKQILHELKIEDYTKKAYTSKKDLEIHRTTQLDKAADVQILKKELKKLEKLLYDHNEELKAVYCVDKKNEWLEKFEYSNKYKNRIKYDPKNCSELKELYKKEQKKINKEKKRVDEMIELMLATDDISKEELDEIKKLKQIDDNDEKEYEKNLEFIEREEMKLKKKLEKELEKEIKKEIGEEQYQELMKELEVRPSSPPIVISAKKKFKIID